MKLGLIESVWFGTPVDLDKGIRLAREIGFDTFDIFRYPEEISLKEKKKLRKVQEDVGIPAVAQTTPAPSLIDFNRPIRRHTVKWVMECLDLAYEFDCSRMVLVPNEYFWQGQLVRPETQWGWAVEGVREIADYAMDLGIEIAMELEPFPNSLINSVEKLIKFIKDVNHKAVKANADVSHLHLIKLPPEELKRLQGLVTHVHFSDNRGQVHEDLPPGRGNAPLKEYLRVLDEIGYNGSISLELEFCPVPDRVVEWVKEAYEVTAKMMSELGIRG